MSQSGQERHDAQLADQASNQIDSDIQALAPSPGTPEAEAVREKIQTVSEGAEKVTLSFEEAMEKVPSLTHLKKLYELAKQCKRAGLIKLRHLGGPKWLVAVNPENEDKEASHNLAQSINEKRRALVDEMRGKRKKRKKGNKPKKTEAQAAAQTDENQEAESDPEAEKELAQQVMETIPSYWDAKELAQLQYTCHRSELLARSRRGNDGKRRYSAIEDKDFSQGLLDAFQAQFRAIREKDRERNRVNSLISKIQEKGTENELFHFAKWIQSKTEMIELKTGKRRGEWVAIPVEGAPGAEAVSQGIMERKEEIQQAEKRAIVTGSRDELRAKILRKASRSK